MKNEELINQLFRNGLSQLQGHYTLEKITLQEYNELQINNMQLSVKQYTIKDVGNLLLMDTINSSTLQMLTFVITPFYKDLPLFSFDAMLMGTNRTFLIEYYDLVKEKNSLYLSYIEQFKYVFSQYNSLNDVPAKPCWYDSLKTASTMKTADESNDDAFLHLFLDSLSEFIEMEYACPPLTSKEKKEKWLRIKDYVDQLIEKGGTSTDLVKVALGEDKTKEFFHSIFFGTNLY